MDENTQVSLYGKLQVLSQGFFWFGMTLYLLIMAQASAYAQIHFPDVHEEPFHRVIFENADFRMLHVQLNLGDTSAFHLHDTPIYYVNTHSCKMFLEDLSGSKIVELPERWIGADLWSRERGLVHRISPLCENGLNLYAFQRKKQLLTEMQPYHKENALYARNGFEVWKHVFTGDKLEIPSPFPMILMEGTCQMKDRELKAGSVLMPEVLKEVERCSQDAVLYWVHFPEP